MGEIMREAQFSLAEANFAAGDFRYVSYLITISHVQVIQWVIFFNFFIVTEC
jgi:hypothetical protein